MEKSEGSDVARGVEISAATPCTLRLRFTGSGAEYFRIWIVNLALTLCTLGLYYLWAKVRKLKYLYNHTLLDGMGFDFHASPRAGQSSPPPWAWTSGAE